MSIEASVEELYGDTRDEAWKAKEVTRLKAEQGIVELEEPKLNTDGLNMQMEANGLMEGLQNASKSNEQSLQNESEGVSGITKGGQ